ncbi:MAG: protein-L-isoaspartate(D-aspartate) O-methyltransferase [Gammaproteobacteria bacterium]|jgi:protein-L-isoaspartate(D-aspartate) O-methyltransferase|nr:protein-L-isoaspartate(D-aspartate) O-methyltransferase [Gammaproteobacteria bacterium]
MDLNIARTNMLKQQIHACQVDDPAILDVIRHVPREAFVLKKYINMAFADTHLPIGCGQTMFTPMEEARTLAALDIQSSDTVLEIGTGSGYFTALLAQFASKVTSLEITPELHQRAALRLKEQEISNVELIQADGIAGYKNNSPYDVIVITGSLPYLPAPFRRQLRCGGRLFCILGHSPAMEAVLYRRQGEERWSESILFETDLASLIQSSREDTFVF